MSESAEGRVADAPAATTKSRREGRSPNYPFFDLERSLARASQLFDKERTHATPVMTALKHWGYTNATGRAAMTLSSLKQFGLIDDIGRGDGRQVKLTTRAYDILNTPHEEERQALLREAALLPDLHTQLWQEYGNLLPSDSALAWNLTKNRGFTSSGAEDFIRQWKRTMEYAQLDSDPEPRYHEVTVSDQAGIEDSVSASSSPGGPPSAQPLSRVEQPDRYHPGDAIGKWTVTGRAATVVAGQQFPIPLPGGAGTVTLAGEFPLRESDWNYFMAVLAAMKPGLVEAPAPAARSEASPSPERH